MSLLIIVVVVLLLAGVALLIVAGLTDFDFSVLGGILLGVGVVLGLFSIIATTYNIKTGYAGLEKNFSGSYTGKVVSKTGTHWFSIPASHDMEKVDIRNNKLPVTVNVMKDKTYNVSASVEVVYDLKPSKLVNLKSNYSDYKNTVIGATVKQVITSNNSLANSQTLSQEDQQQITEKLDKFGIVVTNIYMNSYKLTNSSNFGFNSNNNNGNK
mgnify:CR=1 FL=1